MVKVVKRKITKIKKGAKIVRQSIRKATRSKKKK